MSGRPRPPAGEAPAGPDAATPTRGKRREPLPRGSYVAAAGAIATIVSLFLPWYSLNLPADAREAITQGLPQALRELGRSLLEGLIDSVGGTAWEAFSGTDIVLLACAAIVLGLTLLGAGVLPPRGRLGASDAGRATMIVGSLTTGLVLVKIIDQPGPNAFLDVDYGAYVALAGGAAMALGGWSAGARR